MLLKNSAIASLDISHTSAQKNVTCHLLGLSVVYYTQHADNC